MLELRQACRGLVRRPAYTAASIGTLALVIGINAALFAAVNATLFRPIPLGSGERTVNLYLMPPGVSDPTHRNPLHAIDLVRLRERSRALTHIAAFTTADRVIGTGADPAVVSTAPRNSKSTAPSPFDAVVTLTSGPVAGRGIVWNARAAGSLADHGTTPWARWQIPSVPSGRPPMGEKGLE